ncbi:MAG TPA: SCP2 sterol-binding domain-containing protein [Xanthomonadales bacterium]|nr:SCP2 sterol-binding domain-containing protein [Xanthomonadales bacterium]
MAEQNPRSYRTPLPGLLATSLEAALNRLLAADQNSGERLQRLDGRCVRLQLEDLSIALDFRFDSYRVAVTLADASDADTVISGSLPALIAMAMPDESGRWGGPGSRVKISGDATLARDLERLFSQLDPDWEAGIARFTGDVLGYQLASGLKGFGQALKNTGLDLQDLAGEYLRSEQSPLAQAGELRAFADEVDSLRDATDRLEARLRLLTERRDENSKGAGS